MSLKENEPQKKLPLWFIEERLPTDAEIKANKGFPSQEEEKLLREKFIENFREKVADFLKTSILFLDKIEKRNTNKPSRKFSPNEIEQVTYYLYGIYFYNLISGGGVINNEDLGMIPSTWGRKEVTKNSDDLDDWPIHVSTAKEDIKACADVEIGIALIYESQFHDIDGKQKTKYTVRSAKKSQKTEEISYTSTTNNGWITTGIEEAQHLHFYFLREKREYDKKQKINKKIETIFTSQPTYVIETGPLQSFIERSELDKTKNSNPNFVIDYYSLIGEEFAAHIVKAKYVEKYLPNVWQSGYQEYDLAVRKNRKKALRKH